jgi:hypothetical protein
MTELESWLNQATRRLARDSAAQVRTEIQQHYESARETAISRGASVEDADASALTALGDAGAANRQYRKVLLTSGEARALRQGNCEARAICSRPLAKWWLFTLPAAALAASAVAFLAGNAALARDLLIGGIATALLFTGPFLPVYTPIRGRIFRVAKFVVVAGALALTIGPDALRFSWLLIPSLWPMFWIEWTRYSIRRKLPVAKWPRQLYL